MEEAQKERRRQCCPPRCKSVGLLCLLDSDFTPFSVKTGQTGLGIVLVFRVKRLRFLFSGVEMGLSTLVSVSNISWKSARKEGADCFASPPVPCGAPVTEQMAVCTAVCSSLSPVAAPHARLERLSWPPSVEDAFSCLLGSL